MLELDDLVIGVVISLSRLAIVSARMLTPSARAYMTYLFFAYPTIWGGNDLAYGFAGGGLAFILIVYMISKSYHISKGLDISLAFKEIPPE
jgi:hypothetical protein